MKAAAGALLGLVARLWLATLRVTVEVDPALVGDDRPWVLAFFHGTIWPLLAWPRRRPTAALVSLSDDGQLFGAALRRLGLVVVAGSTSRGGARGLAGLVRLLRRGEVDVAVAVDGPRGPAGVAKPGALVAARLSGARVVPMGAAVASGRRLGSWDGFALAWPFSRVAVVLGAPLQAPDPGKLAQEIATANQMAANLLQVVGMRQAAMFE